MKIYDYQKQGIPLESLPLYILQGIDIETPDEEKVIQELVDKKRQLAPVNVVINRPNDRTDFKTPAEEAEFQKEIDARVSLARPKVEEEIKEPVKTEEELENKIGELKEEKVKLDRFCEFCDAKGPIKHKANCTR